MSQVSRAEREEQVKNDAQWKYDIEAKRKAVNDGPILNLSVAHRLMARAKRKTFTITIRDKLEDGTVDDLNIVTRVMTTDERYQALGLSQKASNVGADFDEYRKIMDDVREIAKDVTVTPGMDEYYDSEWCTEDIIMLVVMNTVKESMSALGDSITQFREE